MKGISAAAAARRACRPLRRVMTAWRIATIQGCDGFEAGRRQGDAAAQGSHGARAPLPCLPRRRTSLVLLVEQDADGGVRRRHRVKRAVRSRVGVKEVAQVPPPLLAKRLPRRPAGHQRRPPHPEPLARVIGSKAARVGEERQLGPLRQAHAREEADGRHGDERPLRGDAPAPARRGDDGGRDGGPEHGGEDAGAEEVEAVAVEGEGADVEGQDDGLHRAIVPFLSHI